MASSNDIEIEWLIWRATILLSWSRELLYPKSIVFKKNEFNILYLSGEENKEFKCIKTILVTTPQEMKLN